MNRQSLLSTIASAKAEGTSNFWNFSNSFLKYLLILISLYFIITYIWVALNRIDYPFELEWQEGEMVDHCRWILSGEPLYSAPDLAFTSSIYPPLYFYLGSLLMKALGIGFFALRLISFLASMGVLFLIFDLVRREVGAILEALFASGLFAASYRATGAWFDLARIDSLFIFWLALGFYICWHTRGRQGALFSAIIFSLAFHTKQFSMAPALGIALWYLIRDRRQFFTYIAALVVGVGGGMLWLNYHYQGWYWFYVFKLPANHYLVEKQLISYWTDDIISTFPVAFAGMVYLWVRSIKKILRDHESNRDLLLMIFSLSLLVAAWVGRGHVNGYSNVIIPLVLAFSLIVGIEMGKFRRNGIRLVFLVGVNLIIIIQFVILLYLPITQIPSGNDRQAGKDFIAFLRTIADRVFIPYHGYLPYLAGKGTSAHWMAILDVLIAGRGKDCGPAHDLLGQLEKTINDKKYEFIILDRDDWFSELIESNYEKKGIFFSGRGTFSPVTGYRTRPQFIYRRISPGKKF